MQDYKMIVRGISGSHTAFDGAGNMVAQNASEFMAYLNEMYLAQGYTILNVTTTRTIPADANTGLPTIYERIYDLVKTVEPVPSKAKVGN